MVQLREEECDLLGSEQLRRGEKIRVNGQVVRSFRGVKRENRGAGT